MHIEELREHCIRKNGVKEGFPFGNDTLVFKVDKKIFLLINILAKPLQFNAKCNPDKAIQLRDTHASVKPGYHMNKTHWNTVVSNGIVPDGEICDMIDHSYDLIVKSLTKKQRTALGL